MRSFTPTHLESRLAKLNKCGPIDKTQRAKFVLHAECPERNIMFQSDDDTVSWPRLKILYIYTPHCAGPSFDTLHSKRAKSKRVPPRRIYALMNLSESPLTKSYCHVYLRNKAGRLAPDYPIPSITELLMELDMVADDVYWLMPIAYNASMADNVHNTFEILNLLAYNLESLPYHPC